MISPFINWEKHLTESKEWEIIFESKVSQEQYI